MQVNNIRNFCIHAVVIFITALSGATVFFFMQCSPADVEGEDEEAYYSAYQLYKQDKYVRAAEAFADIVEHYSYSHKVDDSRYYAGWCTMQIGDSLAHTNRVRDAVSKYLEAFGWFGQIDKRSTRYVEGRYWSAKIQSKIAGIDSSTVSVETALEALGRFVDKYPKNRFYDNAFLAKANTLRHAARCDEAIVIYSLIIRQYSDSSIYDNALYWGGKCAHEEYEKDTTAAWLCDSAVSWLTIYINQKEINGIKDSTKFKNAQTYIRGCNI